MGRKILGVVFVLYLVALALIGFWPVPVDTGERTTLQLIIDHLKGDGLAFASYGLIEFVANVVLFIPLGLLVAALMRRGQRWVSFAITVAASLTIELGQFLFLPERDPSALDVIANSIGGAIGVAIIAFLSWAFGGRRRHAVRD